MAAVTFLERGLADTSIQDIAERLGLPKANIYYHFGSKEELLYEIVIVGLPPLNARLQEIVGYPLSAKDRLRLAFRANARASVEEVHAAVVTMLRRDIAFLTSEHRAAYVALRDEYQAMMRRLLEEGVANGEFSATLDVKLTSFAILGLLGSLNHWFQPGGPLTYEEVADSWWELICCGLERRGA